MNKTNNSRRLSSNARVVSGIIGQVPRPKSLVEKSRTQEVGRTLGSGPLKGQHLTERQDTVHTTPTTTFIVRGGTLVLTGVGRTRVHGERPVRPVVTGPGEEEVSWILQPV